MVFCFSFAINRSFLSLKAETTNHNHQSFTGGRLEWEINTYDSVQDINVDGTTFKAAGIIILNYYLTNTSTGTLRFYFTGFSSSIYQAMNIYTYGATISNVVYSGGNPGITFKINNPVDRVTVVITFTGTDLNNTLQGITPSTTGSSLTNASSSDTTVQDIDVKLSGISSTLQQILTLLGSGSTSITDYLDDITVYSSYLENINYSLDNIAWNTIVTGNGNYRGYTTDFVNYDTTPYVYHDAGYIVFNNVALNLHNNTGLFMLTIPIGATSITFDDIEIYQLFGTSNIDKIDIETYMYFNNRNTFYLYFIINDIYNNGVNDTYPWVIKVNKRFYLYNINDFKLTYILQSDPDYWMLLQAIQNRTILESFNMLINNSNQSDITDQIDDVITDLNDVTQQSQTIENQQVNNLDSFNNQIDLDDYNFNFNSRNGIEYFKLKLTDIYDINEFKPFYLIPIVLFVLMALLRG